MFAAYEIGLAGLSATQISEAAREALRTCKFFPAPSELREIANEQRPKIVPEYLQAEEQFRHRDGGFEALPYFLELLKVADTGGDIHAAASQMFPVDDEHEPRYRCLICSDTGKAIVWGRYSMRLAAQKKLTKGRGCYREAIRCSCSAGNKFDLQSRKYNPSRKPEDCEPLIYDPKKWRLCHGFSEFDILELTSFMERWQPANHVTAFDEWNNA